MKLTKEKFIEDIKKLKKDESAIINYLSKNKSKIVELGHSLKRRMIDEPILGASLIGGAAITSGLLARSIIPREIIEETIPALIHAPELAQGIVPLTILVGGIGGSYALLETISKRKLKKVV